MCLESYDNASVTPSLVTLVGQITGTSDLPFIGSHLLSSVCYQFEVMANRPHQSLIYRITDADTRPDSVSLFRSLWEVPDLLSCTADGSSCPGGGGGGGEGGGSFLVIFWRGTGGTRAGREKSE